MAFPAVCGRPGSDHIFSLLSFLPSYLISVAADLSSAPSCLQVLLFAFLLKNSHFPQSHLLVLPDRRLLRQPPDRIATASDLCFRRDRAKAAPLKVLQFCDSPNLHSSWVCQILGIILEDLHPVLGSASLESH